MPLLSGHVARTRSRSPGQQTFEAITRGQVRFRMRHTYLYLRLDERNTTGWLRRRRTVAGEREVVPQKLRHETRQPPVILSLTLNVQASRPADC